MEKEGGPLSLEELKKLPAGSIITAGTRSYILYTGIFIEVIDDIYDLLEELL